MVEGSAQPEGIGKKRTKKKHLMKEIAHPFRLRKASCDRATGQSIDAVQAHLPGAGSHKRVGGVQWCNKTAREDAAEGKSVKGERVQRKKAPAIERARQVSVTFAKAPDEGQACGRGKELVGNCKSCAENASGRVVLKKKGNGHKAEATGQKLSCSPKQRNE